MLLENNSINLKKIKIETEQEILSYGADINQNLPLLVYNGLRNKGDIVKRVSAMTGLIYFAYGSPLNIIDEWITKNDLYNALSDREKVILQARNNKITEHDKIQLSWYSEGIWALLWVCGLIYELKFKEPVKDYCAKLAPDIRDDSSRESFAAKVKMRNELEVYKMTDLYYRLHWYVVNSRISGHSSKGINEEIIVERRRALEYVINPQMDWDDIDLST